MGCGKVDIDRRGGRLCMQGTQTGGDVYMMPTPRFVETAKEHQNEREKKGSLMRETDDSLIDCVMDESRAFL